MEKKNGLVKEKQQWNSITFRVTLEERESIGKYAEMDGRDRSNFIRWAVREYIKKLRSGAGGQFI